MTVASSNFPKIGVKVVKEKYEFDTDSNTSKKSDSFFGIQKNCFGSDSNQKHATPTSNANSTTLAETETTYGKSRVLSRSRYSKVSSHLGLEALCLESPLYSTVE